MVSVIIAARNEKYLEQTIRNILENAEGEIEIIAELDGYLPDPKIDLGDDRVVFIHHKESIGQRQCINHGAKIAKGKYIMKLDAHCAVDKGFDVKLAKDCEYDWTVIPRMYNLNIETFEPKFHKRTDYMYISSPNAEKPFRAQYYGSKQPKNDIMIDDTMCNMGPGWFMHKDRYWELDGMDEGHGGWGQMGIEVSCKAWLSGGRQVVNKNTWFAHWFRGGSYDEKFSPGFPYKISGNDQERARRYSRDLWLNNKWPKQKRKFEWLVNKFNPPTWNGEYKMPELYKPRNAKSHIHSRAMRTKNLYNNLEYYWHEARAYRAKSFIKDGISFFKAIHEGKTFTDEELIAHPYYQYLRKGFKRENKSRILSVMKDGIELYHSMKKNGMREPIEMFVEGNKYSISRGTRRIIISHLLGRRVIGVRLYKSKEHMDKFRLNAPDRSGRLTQLAGDHFAKMGWKATDKHWLHNYMPYYDRHSPNKDAEKILEIGVKYGGSIKFWHDAFPKAKIYGVDIDLRNAWKGSRHGLLDPDDRTILLEGSQTDEKFNKEQVVPCGPFDMIVDDASHIAQHQIAGFKLLWPSVKSGGWYVVEDLYYRNYARNKDTKNMIRYLKNMVDNVNEDINISELHFYYNICFIRKR
jgi:hypothetical protein